jgi:hypothetical protein
MTNISIFHCYVFLEIDVQILWNLLLFHSFIENNLCTKKTINEEDNLSQKIYSQQYENSDLRFPPRDCWVTRSSGCCLVVVLANFFPTFRRNIPLSFSGLWVKSRTHNRKGEGGTLLPNIGKPLPNPKTCFLSTKKSLQPIKSISALSCPVRCAASFPHDLNRIFRCSLLSFSRLLHKRPNVWLYYGPHALRERERMATERTRVFISALQFRETNYRCSVTSYYFNWIHAWCLQNVSAGSFEVILKNNLVSNTWVAGLLKDSYVPWLLPMLRHGRRNWIHCYCKRSVTRWRNTVRLQRLLHPVLTCGTERGNLSKECDKYEHRLR